MSLSIIILTGQSGSGKSTAIHALEDQDFLCVDNMPASLGVQVAQLTRASASTDKLALVMDVRETTWLEDVPQLISNLRASGETVRLVYLEANEDAILRRYSETRRRHPLDGGDGLRLAIAREASLLAPLRELADDTIDTTGLSPHELRGKILHQLAGVALGDDLSVALVSFGFKRGLPLDADMVFDVRFLPNPYFEPSMRKMSGLDAPVQQYVVESTAGKEYVQQTCAFLLFLIPQFKQEGKRYLTVAIGCTGGQHRSVSVARSLHLALQGDGINVDLRHRDVVLP